MSKANQAIIVPPKLCIALGEEAAVELVQFINEVTATTSSFKVDKTEYDAHALLIDEKFERFKSANQAEHERLQAEVKHMIDAALLKGLAWLTVLNFGLLGALWAFVNK